PFTCNLPDVMFSRPATNRKKVLLPQPLGPSMLTNRPGGTSVLTSDSASTPRSPPYRLVKLSAATAAGLIIIFDQCFVFLRVNHAGHVEVGRRQLVNYQPGPAKRFYSLLPIRCERHANGFCRARFNELFNDLNLVAEHFGFQLPVGKSSLDR